MAEAAHSSTIARSRKAPLQRRSVNARRSAQAAWQRRMFELSSLPNSCDRSIYRAGEIQAIVRNCARRGFPMAKTFVLVSVLCAGLRMHSLSRRLGRLGIRLLGPGAVRGSRRNPAVHDPEAAAGAITADCYYQWKGRGGGTYQCPVRPPRHPKNPRPRSSSLGFAFMSFADAGSGHRGRHARGDDRDPTAGVITATRPSN